MIESWCSLPTRLTIGAERLVSLKLVLILILILQLDFLPCSNWASVGDTRVDQARPEEAAVEAQQPP